MNKIFRHVNLGLLMATILAVGAVAGFGQNPCDDAAGIAALDAKFRENYDKDLTKRQIAVEAGKQYIEKYAECPPSKDFVEYLRSYLPGMEAAIAKEKKQLEVNALVARFDTGLKSKNWNEVYTAGKQVLAENGDAFRDAELVLGSIGLDETAKTPRVTTWNDDTIKYAKMAIADLEANKTFTNFGVAPFKYKNKEDALGWMNYTLGYIYFYDKNNKKDALGYLYKASQLNSDTKTNPVLYETVGSYYFDDVRKLAGEVDTLVKSPEPETPELVKQKVDDIKAKVAMVNGTAEAAIDAYARAHDLAKKNPKIEKAYTEGLYKKLQDLYNVRFGKMEGFDAYIANTVKKPMPNPQNPVAPVRDAEPATAAASTSSVTSSAVSTPELPATAQPAAPSATKVLSGSKPATVAKKPMKRRAK